MEAWDSSFSIRGSIAPKGRRNKAQGERSEPWGRRAPTVEPPKGPTEAPDWAHDRLFATLLSAPGNEIGDAPALRATPRNRAPLPNEERPRDARICPSANRRLTGVCAMYRTRFRTRAGVQYAVVRWQAVMVIGPSSQSAAPCLRGRGRRLHGWNQWFLVASGRSRGYALCGAPAPKEGGR